MFAASCLGTNLGDFWVDELGVGRMLSFASLAFICVPAVAADTQSGDRTEAFYWVAILALRAAATNAADYLTHDIGLAYGGTAVALGVIALLLGSCTRPAPNGRGSPGVDGWYWAAMLAAGLMGTVAGDLASHTVGLFTAAAMLTLVLLIMLWLRSHAPVGVLGYWCAVLAERCAGTPVGDSLAGRHGLGLGLKLAMVCTGAFFSVALIIRRRLVSVSA